MKKVIAAVLTFLMVFTFSFTSASNQAGSRFYDVPSDSTKLASGVKIARYYSSSGKLLFSLGIYASFAYDGRTVECIHSQYFRNIEADDCKFNSRTGTIDHIQNGQAEAVAAASGDFMRCVFGIPVDSVNIKVSITCDKNGKIY